MKTIYLGAGCFWGVEELLRRKHGITSVCSGYMGGDLKDPCYEDICTGRTGHAEVVKVEYDGNELKTENLLKYFFQLHDPTQLNRQGVDIGTQYRSVIYFTEEQQESIAKDLIARIDSQKIFQDPIQTSIEQAPVFYPAEDYHQKYYLKKYTDGHGPLCHYLRDIDLDSI